MTRLGWSERASYCRELQSGLTSRPTEKIIRTIVHDRDTPSIAVPGEESGETMNSTVHEPEGNNLWYEEPSTDLCFLDELDAVPADSMGGQVYHRTPFKPSWADWMSGRERQSGCLKQQCGDVEQKVNQLRSMLEERKKEPVANYVETVLPQRLAQGMRPEQAFRAGALHSMAAVWERYLQLGSVPGEQQLRASTMLRKGVALEWCHPLDAHKQLEPRHKARTAGVCAQLQEAGFSREAARGILSADSPASVVLGNRFANEEHRNFAREQIRTNVARGAVVEWKWKGLRPWIVLPLSVCVNSAGKMRLIVDGRYVNLFLRRMLFKYETASDAARMLRDMQWIWTLDFMSGYHHLLLRPEDWTYVGLQLDGQLYVHAALPFGLSQAPAVFTSITQLGYSVLQQAGGSLTGMVDDSLGAAKGLSHAARDMATQVVVLGALGWTLSSKKCMMRPGRVAEYLGFRFDMEARMMFVPEAKLNRLLAGLRDLKQSWSRCKQQSMAGMLASMGLAMPFSPMMVRALRYEAEKVEEEPVLGMELTSFLETNMIELNGRPWDAAIRAAVILVVDTSESATGAYIQGMSWSAIINFDADDLARMAAGNYSSTEREVVGILRALREVLRSRVLQQTGYGAIQVICDNKGAVSALQHLRGGYSVFPTVAKVHMLAKEEGIVLTFAWEPRDTDRVQRADDTDSFFPEDLRQICVAWSHVDCVRVRADVCDSPRRDVTSRGRSISYHVAYHSVFWLFSACWIDWQWIGKRFAPFGQIDVFRRST